MGWYDTPTSIANMALSALGTRSSISSLNENSNEAREILLHWHSTRRQVLRAAHWGFARAYFPLALVAAAYGTPEYQALHPQGSPPPTPWSPSGDQPPPPWLYAYNLPADYVAMRYIRPKVAVGVTSPPIFGSNTNVTYPDEYIGPLVKYELASASQGFSTVVLCNQSQPIACYTRDVQDVTQFDEGFLKAYANGLAVNICNALTGDLKQLEALVKLTNNMLLAARAANANEGLNANDVVPDWLRCRGIGPAVGTGPHMAEYGPLFGGVL